MSRRLNASMNAKRPQDSVMSTDSNQPNRQQPLDEPPKHEAFHHPRKAVSIADYSEMRIYIRDRSYQSNKSYSSDAIQLFRVRASFEALRIQNMISYYPLQTWSAVNHAMELGLLTLEEVVGIEHLVCENAAEEALRERRAHVDSVLKAQELLREKSVNVTDCMMLAKFACMSSAKHAQKARARATWSFVPEKNASGTGKKIDNASAKSSISRLKSDIRAAFAA